MKEKEPIWTVVASWFAPDSEDVDLLHAVLPPEAGGDGGARWWEYPETDEAAAADEAERTGAAVYDTAAPRAWAVEYCGSGRYFRTERGARGYIRERWGLEV
jgi:hypothetical protein